MNIAFLLQPKSDTAYLYDDFTLRQGLEKMRHHGYTAIPVIDREGKYITTISAISTTVTAIAIMSGGVIVKSKSP